MPTLAQATADMPTVEIPTVKTADLPTVELPRLTFAAEPPTVEMPVVAGGSDNRRWIAFAVVLLAAMLDNIDASIVTVAMPEIQRGLGTTFAVAQWSLAGYALSFALLLITGGRLGDIFGRKRVFLLGIGGFVLASAVCAFATSAAVFLGGRVLQGASAALMVPQVMSVMVTQFRKEEWPTAGAIMGAVLGVGSVSGPTLGGLLTDLDLLGLGWRMIFLVNLPIGLLSLALAAWYMRESRSDAPLRVDGYGMLLLIAAAFALMYPLVQGREQGWPWWMFLCMVLSLPVFALFGRYQWWRHRSRGSALVPPTLFRQRSFTIGLIANLLLYSGVGSLFMVLSYELQLGLHWPITRTALAMMAWPVGILATFRIAQRRRSVDERVLVAAGAVIMAVGTLVLVGLVRQFGADIAVWQVALPNLVAGLGMGLCSPVLTRIVLGDVPASEAGAGSGVVNAVVQFGSAAGIAVTGALFFGLADSGTGDFSAALATALWYNIAVFLTTAVLCPLLPGSSASRN